jgi:hypothetical protein
LVQCTVLFSSYSNLLIMYIKYVQYFIDKLWLPAEHEG